MRGVFFIIANMVLLTGCDLGIYEDPYKDCVKRPVTKQEQQMIKSLESKTNKVYLFRMDYTYRPNSVTCVEDMDYYQIVISESDSLLKISEDSAKVLTKKVMLEVYDSMLFDSLRYSITRYEMFIYSLHKGSKHSFSHCNYITKKDMENYLGRKIVQGKNGYEWIEIPKKPILQIHRGDCF